MFDLHRFVAADRLIMPRKAPSKRGLTLDLNAPNAAKKTRLQQAAAAVPVLTTPDVQMLKLSSPELAKFLTSSNSLPSGSTLPTPTAGSGTYLFPKNVTEEQELYAKGFEEALNNLKSKEAPESAAATAISPKGSSLRSNNTAAAIDAIERATSAHNTRARAVVAAAATATAAAVGTGGQIPTAVSDIPAAAVATSSVPAAAGHLASSSSSRPPSAASGSVDSSECDSVEIKEEQTDDDDDEAEAAAEAESSSSSGKRKRSSGSAASSSASASGIVSPIDMEDQGRCSVLS